MNTLRAIIFLVLLGLLSLPGLLWPQEGEKIGEIERISAIAAHYDEVTPIVMSAADLIDGLYLNEDLISSDPQLAETKTLAVQEELAKLRAKLCAVVTPTEAEPASQLLLIWFDDLEQVITLFQESASPDSTTPVADRLVKYQQARVAERSAFESAKQAYIKLLGDYGIPLQK